GDGEERERVGRAVDRVRHDGSGVGARSDPALSQAAPAPRQGPAGAGGGAGRSGAARAQRVRARRAQDHRPRRHPRRHPARLRVMRMEEAIDALGEPYPGLRSFRRDETHIFFGREGAISEMVDRLAAHHFLAVTGISGSGKSSLVRTGLLDALDRGMLVGAGSDWRVADLRPGGQPLSRLATALAEALETKFTDQELGLIGAKLASGPMGLVGWLDEIRFPRATNLLL